MNQDGFTITERAGREGDTQPIPVASESSRRAHAEMIADIAHRRDLGITRYGQPLSPFNGRDSLKDAYEEMLDLGVYIKNRIIEMEEWDAQIARYNMLIEQVDRLAKFIMENIPGEPSEPQGAIDTAIRLLTIAHGAEANRE